MPKLLAITAEMLPPWPPRDPEIAAAIGRAIADGSWGVYDGPHTAALETALCRQFAVSHAITCCSGTLAVELALRGLQIGSGDEVAVAAYDFAGNFRAIQAVGARPVLVDLEAGRWRMDLDRLAAAKEPSIKAVIVSHLHGDLAAMSEVCRLAQSRGWAVVEDAAQTPGATIAGKPAGSWGDCGIFSFGGSKLLSAGRGGAVLTNSDQVRQRIKIFCERGNHAFPLSELQALVLLPQLEKLAERNRLRARGVNDLLSRLAGQSVLKALVPNPESAYYKLPFWYDPHAAQGKSRSEVIRNWQALGAPVDEGFRGFVLRPQSVCRSLGPLENARRAAELTILLHHPILLANAQTLDRLAAILGGG